MKTKKINSKRKGNRTELELAKILSEHFGVPFARVGVASGARAKNTKLPDSAVGVMTSDIIVPDGFRFSIESKSANIDIDLLEKSAAFEKWLQQATKDARSIGKIPMVCWKKNRKGWIVAVPAGAFKECGQFCGYYVRYGNDTPEWRWGWVVLRLDALLEANTEQQDFWWENSPERITDDRPE